MTINVEVGSPLPPIEIVGDRYLLRPFQHEDLYVVEEASRDDLIPLITTVPSTWTPQAGEAFIDRQNSRTRKGSCIPRRRGTEHMGLRTPLRRQTELVHRAWNIASIKTAERAGYEFEGLLRNWEHVGGVSRDMSSDVRTRSGQPA